MDSVFTMLKQAREAKNLSLADIADTTFISVRFLEAIEAGKTDILPQAYVRAFIREYAAVVGLDPAEVMRRYDSIGSPQRQRRSAPPRAATDQSLRDKALPQIVDGRRPRCLPSKRPKSIRAPHPSPRPLRSISMSRSRPLPRHGATSRT